MKKNNKMRGLLTGDINLVRERIFTNKESFHKDQAKLPFPEKIRILVELQKIADTIKSKKGKGTKFIWWI